MGNGESEAFPRPKYLEMEDSIAQLLRMYPNDTERVKAKKIRKICIKYMHSNLLNLLNEYRWLIEEGTDEAE